MREHVVSILISGVEIRGWSTYQFTSSMIDPVDSFEAEIPFNRDAWDRLKPDRPVKVTIDGVVILDGFLDEREVPESDDVIQVSGRDRVGRLVNESAPGVDFRGGDLLGIVRKLADPWFPTVTLSNERNRRILRGKGRKARGGREPLYIGTGKGTRVEPGQTRWQVIEDLCRQAEILAWSSGDGRELILGKPNYTQEPQFSFFMPAIGTTRPFESRSVLGMSVKESTADRYSEIFVVGSGGGTSANYGISVAQRAGHAITQTPFDFSRSKRLIIEKAVSSSREAQALADREMARRDSRARTVTVRAPYHGQRVSGTEWTIFAPDITCAIEDERTGVRGLFQIVACTYRSGDRNQGEETVLEMVPVGTELVI
jgi:prophage tail gpP-like protein